jgi:DNA-binding beta-propeller fold protein YncE
VTVTKWRRRLRVTGATVAAVCLAWSCASCSSAAGGLVSSADVASVAPGQELWASTLQGGPSVGAVSKAGTAVFVSGYVKTHVETVAYSEATGAQLWAKAYQGGEFSNPVAIKVSPNGARVYVTSSVLASKGPAASVTVAYDARTGQQLWVSRYLPKDGADPSAIAVSPNGASLYVAGRGWASGSHWEFAVIAYSAATGKQQWVRYYQSAQLGTAASVAVSPDGKTIYATGTAGSSAVTVAYAAAGTVKWTARYNSPYSGFAAGAQVVAGPGGGTVYVGGTESAAVKGRVDLATLAYRASTGQRIWRDQILGGVPTAIAVTPDGRSVIVDGSRNTTQIAIASYNSSTGGTQWTTLAPGADLYPSGLVISPNGDTLFIGGNRTVAYSVAHGTVLWATTYLHGSGVFGITGSGARLFGIRPGGGSGMTIAYQT